MNGRTVRVGMRQWRVLLAVDNAWPGQITARAAGEAIRDGLPFSAHKPVIWTLLNRGLVYHFCPNGGCDVEPGCELEITELGTEAHLSRAGQRPPPR